VNEPQCRLKSPPHPKSPAPERRGKRKGRKEKKIAEKKGRKKETEKKKGRETETT
jgi:hypothetical protein